MKSSEKISIIIPIYNVENYLDTCIKSVINQSYSNLEIILVDDGSCDRSGEMCDRYKAQDSRIRVIHKENGGLSDARNAGLDILSGEYILFVDSDDVIHPRMVEILYEQLKRNKADISVCSHRVVNESFLFENINEEYILEKLEGKLYSGKECIRILHGDTLSIDMNVVWNKLFPRKCFESLRFPKGRIHEDEFVNYLFFYNTNKCVYTSLPLYYYRQRGGSIMSCEAKNILSLDVLEIYERRAAFFKEHNEIDLYNLTITNLQVNLMRAYMLIKKHYPERKDLLEKVRDRHKELYYGVIRGNKAISFKARFLNALFIFNKDVYWFFRQINNMRRIKEKNRKVENT